MMQIAVLDQDRSEAELACTVLRELGHACERRAQRDFPQAAASHGLVLADLHHAMALLPVLRAARERGARLPLLLLAARHEQNDIAAALEAGADDYLLRPLRRAELAARVAVLLARFHPRPQAERMQAFGMYAFDLVERRAHVGGRAVTLTQKEFELALLFFRHLGRPLSRAYLQEAIWAGRADAGRSVDTHVSRVRSKLDLRPENGFRLLPVYSFGYRLEQIGARAEA